MNMYIVQYTLISHFTWVHIFLTEWKLILKAFVSICQQLRKQELRISGGGGGQNGAVGSLNVRFTFVRWREKTYTPAAGCVNMHLLPNDVWKILTKIQNYPKNYQIWRGWRSVFLKTLKVSDVSTITREVSVNVFKVDHLNLLSKGYTL